MLAIVIPVYNNVDKFKKTLDSLVAQTKNNFQICVVDDFSKEDIKNVCDEYNDRLHIYYKRLEENFGVGTARNVGFDIVSKSRCDYIMFLDSDDMLFPYAVESLYREARKNNADIVSSNFYAEEKYGISVIEDACQAMGTKNKGKFSGTFGDLGVFSFQQNKYPVISTKKLCFQPKTIFPEHPVKFFPC